VGAAALLLAGCAATPGAQPTASPDELSGTLTVFAAASLTEAFDELATAFERQHPSVDVVLSYGGSSALAAQLGEGAPADVFAAASEDTMQLITDVYAVFATNTLEIAVPIGNPGGVTGLQDFADPALALALCAPEVPCGAAAQQLFAAAGITAAPDTLEQDVKAVLTKVELGEVDAGLVYRTDVRAGQVEGIAFPEAADAVNRYPIAPLTGLGAAFADFVLSEDGQAVLGDHGFGAP
jgi:molybdate transport system substrate-binding protein